MSVSGALTLAALVGSVAFGWRLAGPVVVSGVGRPVLGERAFVAVAWALLWSGWSGIVLAEVGAFGALGLLLSAVLALAVSWWSGIELWPGSSESAAPWRDPTWLAWALAIGLTAALATPVVDARYEARDAGVYRLTAARLQHGGSLTYRDEFVAALPADLRARAFPAPDGRSASRGMGFYLQDPAAGRVVPQFQPLAPVLMAVGRLVGGPAGAEAAILVVAVLALVAVYLTARQIGGMVAGLLASAWTGLNVVHWWFVRYGTAEGFALLLVFTGLYALLRERRDDVVASGVLAGWAFGLLWLTKLELLLLGLPLGLLFLYDIGTARIRRRSTQAFWLVLFAMAGHFFIHAWGWSFPYVRDVLLVPGVTLRNVTSAAGLLVLIAAVLWGWCMISRYTGVKALVTYGSPGALQRGVNGFIWVILAALLVIGYGFRAAGWDQYTVRDLGWVISQTGLVAALVGAAWLLLSSRCPRGTGAATAIMLMMTVAVLYNRQIIPDLLWAYRRYVMFAVPVSLLLAAIALTRAWRLGLRLTRVPEGEHRRRIAGVVLMVLALAGTGAVTAREVGLVRRYGGIHDLEGARGLIARLRRVLEPQAVVIFEPRTRRGLLRLEGVVQQELGLDVLRLSEPVVDRELVEQLVFSGSRAGRPVYLMTSGYLVSPRWLDATPAGRFVLDTRVLEEPGEELPTRQLRLYLDARLYRLQPGGHLADLDGRLDVGGADDLYLDGRTVHQVEIEAGGRSYRWTYADGRFYLPGLSSIDQRILIRMASSYPPSRGRQKVRVLLDGTEIGEVVVGRGWNDYSFDVPPGWVPAAEGSPALDIVVEPVWRPAEMLDSSDPRDVGVAVDLIRWGQ